MRTKLNLQKIDPKLYLPEKAKILRIENFTDKEKFFEVELLERPKLGHVPGQFVQVSILGIGEAPISISSPPADHNRFEMCIRAVGDVTNKIHTLAVGDHIYIRGPFGSGFSDQILATFENKHLLFVVGGLGYAPLRSLINQVVPKRSKYQKISILYGCKTAKDRMYTQELDELAAIGENVELLQTVDQPDQDWQENCGVITTLIPKVKLIPEETIAMVVGPPVMYRFVIKALLDSKLPKQNIYLDLERKMKCGVGKCGHCQMDSIYVCQEGPVFNYADVEKIEELF